MAQLRKRCEWQLQYICPEGGRSSFLHTPLISVSMIYGFLLVGFFFQRGENEMHSSSSTLLVLCYNAFWPMPQN